MARSARQFRADAELLDDLAALQAEQVCCDDGSWEADRLAALPDALRNRVLRHAAIAAGCPPGALTAGHVEALAALITSWHGQRWTDLPGGVRGMRQHGKLLFTAGHPSEPAGPGTPEDRVGRD